MFMLAPRDVIEISSDENEYEDGNIKMVIHICK